MDDAHIFDQNEKGIKKKGKKTFERDRKIGPELPCHSLNLMWTKRPYIQVGTRDVPVCHL